jgi:hypothetical protein
MPLIDDNQIRQLNADDLFVSAALGTERCKAEIAVSAGGLHRFVSIQ